jgi:hypothetical protein
VSFSRRQRISHTGFKVLLVYYILYTSIDIVTELEKPLIHAGFYGFVVDFEFFWMHYTYFYRFIQLLLFIAKY